MADPRPAGRRATGRGGGALEPRSPARAPASQSCRGAAPGAMADAPSAPRESGLSDPQGPEQPPAICYGPAACPPGSGPARPFTTAPHFPPAVFPPSRRERQSRRPVPTSPATPIPRRIAAGIATDSAHAYKLVGPLRPGKAWPEQAVDVRTYQGTSAAGSLDGAPPAPRHGVARAPPRGRTTAVRAGLIRPRRVSRRGSPGGRQLA